MTKAEWFVLVSLSDFWEGVGIAESSVGVIRVPMPNKTKTTHVLVGTIDWDRISQCSATTM